MKLPERLTSVHQLKEIISQVNKPGGPLVDDVFDLIVYSQLLSQDDQADWFEKQAEQIREANRRTAAEAKLALGR